MAIWSPSEGFRPTSQAGPAKFWEALIKHSTPYRDDLNRIATRVMGGENAINDLGTGSGLTVIGLPVRTRKEVMGVLFACGLSGDFDDQENRTRLASMYDFDEALLSHLAIDIPRHTPEAMRSYAQILEQQMCSLESSVRHQKDISDLSHQLARSYEELSLLFRVSADLNVAAQPVSHFERIAGELLESTVAKSFAVVLEPHSGLSQSSIVTAGPLRVPNEEIRQLYEQAKLHSRNLDSCLLINNAVNDPQYAWAQNWLNRFIFFELSSKKDSYGGILAINHSEGQEFGTEEIQLINAVAQRGSGFLENVRLYNDLEQLFMGMLHALVSSIDAKDPYTSGHSQRVACYSRYIAQQIGLPEDQCQRIYLSGLLHDIGKIGIAESVLCKTGRLTAVEFEEMKRHPEIGARILEGMRQVEDLVPGVLYHHERMDGKGYPEGLVGEEIPFFGRLVGIADSLDAMTTNRTYRRALPVQLAMSEIRRCAGTQFDAHLADVLLRQDPYKIFKEAPESSGFEMAL
jgi:HD-GYP domain-containing protein (c-di-GMP phosphodiesterase class II)